jgi:hypothetical protein
MFSAGALYLFFDLLLNAIITGPAMSRSSVPGISHALRLLKVKP